MVVLNKEKFQVIKKELPEEVVNVVRCDNSKCATTTETYVPHKMHLVDRNNMEYRCEYCDHIISFKAV
ncbi:MAG: hypothetical protein MR639_11410 [Clostridium sp.]|uniref:hypothetical protein n=1 Tax=Clostridium sp. TaxID=1506 RepID=UPI002A861CD2|nr:hypothetical protein [Clostridium sp.]MDY5097292.1 hypothetical protein [Clostridium sp.]